MTAGPPLYPKQVLSRGQSDGVVGRARSSAGLVLDAVRRRPVPRRILKVLSLVLLVAGIALFTYPFATDWFANYRQGRLATEFRTPGTERAYLERSVATGHALTRIAIPRIGLDTIVVEGTTFSALRAGAGHYAGTALPCEAGNAAIAGHRTTYSKPFARLDELKVGDRIVLETPAGRCTYQVTKAPFITSPFDVSVVAAATDPILTLTTCNPPGSAAQRMVVRARMVGTPQ